MSESSKSVFVIGGGAIGLCVAIYAAERGHHVTLIDRDGPESNRCSMGNAGLVVPSHFIPLAAPGMVRTAMRMMRDPRSPFYIKPRLSLELLTWGWDFLRAANRRHVQRSAPILRDLHLASLAEYEKLAASCGNAFGLTRNGLLMLCKTAEALEEEAGVVELARALGVSAEVLDKAQTAAKDPGIEMNVAGAVYFPGDCHLSPELLQAVLRERAESLGVELLWNTEFRSWRMSETAGITGIETSRGSYSADDYVLCAGSWSNVIAAGAGIRFPMQPGKGYSLTLTNPPQLPGTPAILTEARVAVTPMGSTVRFGGTMEIAGMDRTINPPRVEGIIRAAAHYYPRFREADFAGVAPWAGLRPCPPDGMPYIGRGRERFNNNLIVATGHAMMGISLAPVTGKIVVQLISGEKPEFDVSPLQPQRFDRL